MKTKENSLKITQELKLFGNVKVLAVTALLAAASFILALLAKSIFGPGPLRLTFENLPIFLTGFLFGPTVGGVTALCADLISCLYTGMAPIPLITIGAVLVGVISGTVFKYVLPKTDVRLSAPIAVVTAHLIGSALVKTLALYPWYGNVVFFRIPIYIGIAAIESLALVFLLKNKSFMNQIGKVIKK